MSRKEDFENLILEIYKVIHQNNQKITSAEPKEKSRLRQDNDQNWENIKTFLEDYASLCEIRGLKPLEDIIDIAAARFRDLAEQLEAVSKAKSFTSTPASTLPAPPPVKEVVPIFHFDYKFLHPHIPLNKDELVQFIIEFSLSKNKEFSNYTNIVTHVCLVLDVSGSMNEQNKYPLLLKAIPYIIDSLSDADRLTIVLFSSESQTIWSRDIVTSRQQKAEILRRIEESDVKFQNTFLAQGLRKAIEAVKRFNKVQSEAVTRVYVLTDGQVHDVDSCLPLNAELRHLGLEINSFGFGQDFDEYTMRQIMDGCPGGRVKWISNTQNIWKSFKHIGEVARNIIATNADLELAFSPSVTLGDAFRFEPGTHWFNTMDDRIKSFTVHIGALESQRSYIYAFEVRTYPSRNIREQIATVTLRYSFQGNEQIVKQNIIVNRTRQSRIQMQVDHEIENIFKVLEGLRSDDYQSQKESFEARLEILYSTGGDQAQIELLERALEEILREGNLASFSEQERVQLNVINRVTEDGDFTPREYDPYSQSPPRRKRKGFFWR